MHTYVWKLEDKMVGPHGGRGVDPMNYHLKQSSRRASWLTSTCDVEKILTFMNINVSPSWRNLNIDFASLPVSFQSWGNHQIIHVEGQSTNNCPIKVIRDRLRKCPNLKETGETQKPNANVWSIFDHGMYPELVGRNMHTCVRGLAPPTCYKYEPLEICGLGSHMR